MDFVTSANHFQPLINHTISREIFTKEENNFQNFEASILSADIRVSLKAAQQLEVIEKPGQELMDFGCPSLSLNFLSQVGDREQATESSASSAVLSSVIWGKSLSLSTV